MSDRRERERERLTFQHQRQNDFVDSLCFISFSKFSLLFDVLALAGATAEDRDGGVATTAGEGARGAAGVRYARAGDGHTAPGEGEGETRQVCSVERKQASQTHHPDARTGDEAAAAATEERLPEEQGGDEKGQECRVCFEQRPVYACGVMVFVPLST